jgi:hypothetical protein
MSPLEWTIVLSVTGSWVLPPCVQAGRRIARLVRSRAVVRVTREWQTLLARDVNGKPARRFRYRVY